MALRDLLKIGNRKEKKEEIVVTKESLMENIDKFRELIAYWRVYPDRFVDYLCSLNPENTFHFYFYQRLFLRCSLRYKYLYATFVRAWSKSFMSVMALMVKAILYPGAQLFTVAGGKEQSASILSSKVDEICRLIPAFEKEIIWDTRGTRAKTRQTKDTVIYTFKNGSSLENVAATEKTRGRRFHSGLMEECVGIDQDILNEVIVPTMNVNRLAANGQYDPNERLNKAQVFITTAGYKGTFSYDKLIQILCQSVARPKEAIVLGGSWRVPVIEGLLDKDFVKQLKLDGTFNEASFEREYESRWTGDIESAFFNSDKFDKNRTVNMAEHKASAKIAKNGYYVMGVDVGRKDCTTEVVIIKVNPSSSRDGSIKQIVNIFTLDEEHFVMQAIKLKRIFNLYKCRIAVVDGNGLGAGLVDLLSVDTVDPDTDEILYGWGVYNDEDGDFKNLKTENTIPDAMYIMKANQGINSDCYAYCQNQLGRGHIKFLIDEATAKNKLLSQEQGKKMTAAQRADYLLPYVQTNILKDQMMNLIEEHEGAHIILKQNNKKIKKDKFSALIYGLYYCKIEEDKNARKKKRNISDFLFFN